LHELYSRFIEIATPEERQRLMIPTRSILDEIEKAIVFSMVPIYLELGKYSLSKFLDRFYETVTKDVIVPEEERDTNLFVRIKDLLCEF
jgi:hypothetical protein